MIVPSGEEVRQAVVLGPFQRVTQVQGLGGGHVDHLIPVPVGGGPGYPMVAGQRVGAGAVAELAQAQHRLPKAGQRPAPLRRVTAAPLGGSSGR